MPAGLADLLGLPPDYRPTHQGCSTSPVAALPQEIYLPKGTYPHALTAAK